MSSQPVGLVLHFTNSPFFDPDTTYFTDPTLKATELALRCIASSITIPVVGACGALWHMARAITALPYLEAAIHHCSLGLSDLVHTARFLPSASIVACVAAIFFRPFRPIALLIPFMRTFMRITSEDVILNLRRLQLDRIIDSDPVSELISRIRRLRYVLARWRAQTDSRTWSLFTQRSELIHDPDSIIDYIANVQYAVSPHARKLKIEFKDELGLDQRGLSRDFLTILFRAVTTQTSSACFSFKKSPLGAMPLVHPGSLHAKYRFLLDYDFERLSERELVGLLRFAYSNKIPQEFFQQGKVRIHRVKDKFTSIINRITSLPQTEQLAYEVLGKFMSIAEKDPRLVIGLTFHSTVFDLICAHTYDELAVDFSDLSDHTLLNLFEIKERQNHTIQKMYRLKSRSFAEIECELNNELLYYIYPEGDFPEHLAIKENFDLFQDAIAERLLILARQDRSLPAIHALCKGMGKSYSEYEWVRLRERGGKVLSNEIQGTLSKADVKRFFSCANDQIRRYFNTWFTETPVEELSQFLQAATGASTICETISVNEGDDLSRYPVFHTCSGQIDMPRYKTYDIFKEKLQAAIANALRSGFTLR